MKQTKLTLGLCMALSLFGACGTEDNPLSQKPETPGTEKPLEPESPDNRPVWTFDVKVMLDRKTYETHYSADPSIVKDKLGYIFKRANELYHGKKDVVYFDADVVFNPVFKAEYVYDESSELLFKRFRDDKRKELREGYPYLAIIDGCIGDHENERTHTDYTPWGSEVVCMFDNNNGAADAGQSVYAILSQYKTAEAFAHELGHGRGVPDIYGMAVTSNEVNGERFSPITCIMNNCWGGDSWSEYSQLLINRNKDIVPDDSGAFHALDEPEYPRDIFFKATLAGQPLAGACINVYKSRIYDNTIKAQVQHTATLTDEGTCKISSGELFGTCGNGPQYGVVLVEVVDANGGSKYYQFVPAYDAQVAFLKGEQTSYTVEMAFK